MPQARPAQTAASPASTWKSGECSQRLIIAFPLRPAISVIIEGSRHLERIAGMPISAANSFGTRDRLNVGAQAFEIHRLESLESRGVGHLNKLPFSLRILLENLLRCEDGRFVHKDDILALANWTPNGAAKEIAFMPARVLLQDFTGVPAVVDFAAMREAVQKMGGNPKRINPLFPAELVIDHSVQVDSFGTGNAFGRNAGRKSKRNVDGYNFWGGGQKDFRISRGV